MTRFLIALLALLGMAAQAPACPRLAEQRPQVGLVSPHRAPAHVGLPDAVRLTDRRALQAGLPARLPAPTVARPAPVLRAPVLPGIERAHE